MSFLIVQIYSFSMLFSLFFTFVSSDDKQCASFSDNCEMCLGLGKNISCGWCRETKECVQGTSDGPTGNTCSDWTFKFNMQCHWESEKPLSFGTRVGVATFSGIVTLATIVFWACVFPQCSKKKTEEDN